MSKATFTLTGINSDDGAVVVSHSGVTEEELSGYLITTNDAGVHWVVGSGTNAVEDEALRAEDLPVVVDDDDDDDLDVRDVDVDEVDHEAEIRRLLEVSYEARVDPLGREMRSYKAIDAPEIRAEGGAPFLIGHAAVFNVETVIAGIFREKIADGAFSKTIREADVRHLFNHDPNYVLARTRNNTLQLREDSVGLAFEAELNMEDPDAVRVAAKVERGDVTQSSFAFIVTRDEWEFFEDEMPLRTIKEVKLFDTSSVTYPAYEEADTTIELKAARENLLAVLEALDVPGDDVAARDAFIKGLASGHLTPDAAPAVRAARNALDRLVVECEGSSCSTRAAQESAPEKRVEESEVDDAADTVDRAEAYKRYYDNTSVARALEALAA